MDRAVPKTGSEEIQLYMRTYYSLLRSSHPVQIETLEDSHMAMESSLHIHARELAPDVSALVYSSLRLPACMVDVDLVLLGPIERPFIDDGSIDIRSWERVYAPGRRRRVHFNGRNALGVFIASRSDIDDLVPTLTAYQIEWNKLHILLQGVRPFLEQNRNRRDELTDEETSMLAQEIHAAAADVRRLCVVWGERFIDTLYKIVSSPKDIHMQM